MIHSLSPKARRLTEQMFVCNPYDIDIRLDDDSSNRAAEIVNVYLKTIGRRLIFEKRKKVRKKITITPVYYTDPKRIPRSPIFYNKEENFDWDADWQRRLDLEQKKKNDKDLAKKQAVIIYAVDRERRKKQWEAERDYDYEKWVEKVKQEKLKKKYSE